jgi:hypothetical protein
VAIRQTISTGNGQLVALTTTGTVYRQQRAADASERLEWGEVDLTGVEGSKVVEIAARPTDGSLVVRTADGRYYEQHSTYYTRAGAWQWRELAGP